MNEYINLTLENIDEEHICCAIGDPKHQNGVDKKKGWIKNKLKDGHIFRKLNARGKIFIEYEPIETAWVPISGKNYEYIYCLWVAGSFKGKGIAKELLEYAINDSKEKGMSGICTLTSKKKKPFIGEKKFFEHYGFKVVDTIGDYELLALQLPNSSATMFMVSASRRWFIDTITPRFMHVAITLLMGTSIITARSLAVTNSVSFSTLLSAASISAASRSRDWKASRFSLRHFAPFFWPLSLLVRRASTSFTCF